MRRLWIRVPSGSQIQLINDKMIKYKVTKNDGSVYDVLLIPIKGTSKYHFVNITKGHICTCEFDNIEDAEKDIQKRLEDKLLKSFTVFNE